MLAVLASVPAQAGDLTAYVRARAADAEGDVTRAAAGYSLALAQAPDSEIVAIRAYREAISAGDMSLARRAASTLLRAKVAPADTALLAFSDALRVRDYAGAEIALSAIAQGPLDFIGPVLRAWIAFERKQDPIAVLDAVKGDGLSARFIAENRALLLIALGKRQDGMPGLRAALDSNRDSLDLRITAAQLLAAKGEKGAGQILLSTDNALLQEVRAQLKGVKPSAAFGASRLFTRLAADLDSEDTRPLTLLLTRCALLLDQKDDRARLVLAEGLAKSEAYDPALAVLAQVDRSGPFARAARTSRLGVLALAGRSADALALAQALSGAKTATAEDAQRHADLLVSEGRYADAAEAYGLAMERGEQGWAINLQRGGALEQAGRWAEAEPYLEKAVELAPDHSATLNYLAYSRIDRGEKVAEARAMLERASRLSPDDPAITDSLGWAYYRSGEYRKAVPLLEKAAAAMPGDTTINEHLGDAYWQLGRRYQARYAWRAAAVYAEGEEAKRIAGKLASGLDAKTASN